jgi:hypothetical protein
MSDVSLLHVYSKQKTNPAEGQNLLCIYNLLFYPIGVVFF